MQETAAERPDLKMTRNLRLLTSFPLLLGFVRRNI